ncbi:sensor histidine kinase [Bacillus sp. FJAT-28004]|uniref:sensor histidine kinase n=1 Tax=Bacillus sp. FJAT-28004 TaxID=1679165 RepID=UPI0006B4EF27|nr:histidine kinase [Bacillus sp. FJAT-28004]
MSWNGRMAFHTIRVKLVIGVLILTLPIVGMLIYSNFYAIQVVRTQVADSYNKMMQLYMNQIDNNLDDIDKYMNNVVALNADFATMAQTPLNDRYFTAKILLFNQMSKDIFMYQSLSSLFVYGANQDDFLEVYRGLKSYEEQDSLRSHIRQIAQMSDKMEQYHSFGWEVVRIGETYYLIHVIKFNDLYMASAIDANKLMIPLNLIQFGEQGGALFASESKPITNAELIQHNGIELRNDMEEYYLSGHGNAYLIVGKTSRNGNFSLIAVTPDDKILENLPAIQRIVSLSPFLSLALIPIGLFLLRRTILIPLNRLIAAMKKIREGNMDTRIDDLPAASDFRIVNETFNQMIDQIQKLKIDVYEEQLSKQKEELHRLQLQMNPHFFLNSLTILYNMAKTNKVDLMMEMTMCLIQHFRFIYRSSMTFVLLKDELEHTRNYLRIQELRFPGSLTSDVRVPDFLLDTPVPPLILQTFVENVVKHAVTLDSPVRLVIEIDVKADQSDSSLSISIRDTGKGFPPGILEELNKGNSVSNDKGEHIGIWNIQRRLRLLYGKVATIRFANENPSGAAIDIVLPLQLEGGKGGL